jgi:hypothetical protein
MSMENHRGKISTGKTDKSTKALWQYYQEIHLTKQEELGERNYEFCFTKYFFHISKGSLTFCKIVRHGPSALLPLRTKACCGFFIALKNPSSQPGFNPRTLGPMANTLTITSPRRQFGGYLLL